MPRPVRQPALIGVALLAGAAALWLYWPTLRLPLIYDTLLHIRIAGELNLATVWLPTEAFGFYRPLTFAPMLLIERLFGGYPAWLLQANNVAQHALNAGLLAALSQRLWPAWPRALAAGALFAFFPFSYQAVAVYGHNVHPALAGLALLGLHSYLTAVAHPRPARWRLLTAALFALMLLTHETAVLFGALAAPAHWIYRPDNLARLWDARQRPFPAGLRALLRQPWLWFLLAGGLYLIAYQFLPISRAPQNATAAGGSLGLSSLYLLQAAVFPLAWFARLAPGVSGAVWVTGSGALLLAWSAWRLRRADERRALLLAWSWWGLASALLAVTLTTNYLLHGPRLLYLSSVGVALLWAILLTPPTAEKAGTRAGAIRRWGGAGVLLFILAGSARFVQARLADYARLTEPVAAAARTLAQRPSDGVLLVNLPQWLETRSRTFPVGVEFAAMLGDYLFVEELIWHNVGGAGRPVWAVVEPALLASPPYAYHAHGQHVWEELAIDRATAVFITSYETPGPQTRYRGAAAPAAAAPAVPLAAFGHYDLWEARAALCGDALTISTAWRPRGDSLPKTTSLFMHVVDGDGRLLAQADGPPLGLRPGLLPVPAGWRLVDARTLTLPETAVAAAVLVGEYDYVSGARSPAADNNQQPLPADAWRLLIGSENCD